MIVFSVRHKIEIQKLFVGLLGDFKIYSIFWISQPFSTFFSKAFGSCLESISSVQQLCGKFPNPEFGFCNSCEIQMFANLVLFFQPSIFLIFRKNLWYPFSSRTPLSGWGCIYSFLLTKSMNCLTDTRMWRSGHGMQTDENFHAFLVTLCFPDFTRQKRSSSCSRIKLVFRKTSKCGVVEKGILKLLTPSVHKKFEKVFLCYSQSELFGTLFFGPHFRLDFEFFL